MVQHVKSIASVEFFFVLKNYYFYLDKNVNLVSKNKNKFRDSIFITFLRGARSDSPKLTRPKINLGIETNTSDELFCHKTD